MYGIVNPFILSKSAFAPSLDLSSFELLQAYGKESVRPDPATPKHVKQSLAEPQSESSPVNIVHLRDTT